MQGRDIKREDLIELEKIGAVIETIEVPAEGEYKDYFFEVDENYVVTILGKVKGEKPSIQAEVITTEIVEQGGTVEIKVTASISEGNITEIVATNGAVLKTDTSATEKVFEVSKNGIYYFKTKADNGRSATASVEINTIIEKPVIEIKNITKTSFTIEVTNNYKEGLITEYKYYVGGVLKSPTNTIAKEYEVTGLIEGTEYTDIYVEVYIGETNIISDTKTANTKSIWDELGKVAEVISNNDDTITKNTSEVNITVDGKEYKLAVGDEMALKVNGVSKTVRIVGFNHDTLSDTAAYGEGKTNTYAGISFEFLNSIMGSLTNSTEDNASGWGGCTLRNTLNSDTELNKLENKKQIKKVNKTYLLGHKSTTTQISQDKIWLLSCSEIWDNGFNGTGTYGCALAKEGEQYKYYKDIDPTYDIYNAKLIKDSTYWWLRSPRGSWDTYNCHVNPDGYCGQSAAGNFGIAPGFAI